MQKNTYPNKTTINHYLPLVADKAFKTFKKRKDFNVFDTEKNYFNEKNTRIKLLSNAEFSVETDKAFDGFKRIEGDSAK